MRKFSSLMFFTFAVVSTSTFFACSESDNPSSNMAGGVSEEENTIAGVLVDVSGKPARGTVVQARYVTVDSLNFVDTTDQNGKFAFPLKRLGKYGISAQLDSQAVFETVEFDGKSQEVSLELKKSHDFKGRVAFDSGLKQKFVNVSLPGSAWKVKTDEEGSFELSGMPEGTYSIKVESPDRLRYDNAIFILDVESSRFVGPLPESMADADSLLGGKLALDGEGDRAMQLPANVDYNLISWWPMDVMESSDGNSVMRDVHGGSETILVYGDAKLVDGAYGKAFALNSADQFGVIESDNGILDSLSEMTLEVTLMVDSLDREGVYRKNMIGKLGFGSAGDKDVFSLAAINGECGAESPRLAFFLADGSGDSLSCDNAVVAKAPIELGHWTRVVVVWSRDSLRLYQNANLDASAKVSVQTLGKSDEPIFFGKEDINLKLDDVRLGENAITSDDVLYRYYLRGGTL